LNLGDRDGAIASMRKAIALRERLARATQTDPRAVAQLARSHAKLFYVLVQGEEARQELEKTKSVLDSIAPRDSEAEAVLGAWMLYFDAKAGLEAEAYDLVALRETRRRQMEVTEKLFALQPSNHDSQHNLALVYKQYGSVLQALKDSKAAREFYDKALALDRKTVEAEPLHPEAKLDLSFSYGSIGSLLREQGDADGALAAHQSAFELRQAVYTADPKNTFALESLVWAHKSIAGVLAEKGDLPGAVSHEREVLKLRETLEKIRPSPHGNAGWRASFHSSVADHRVRIASQPLIPPARRLEHWRGAREEYSKALAFWLERGKGMPLHGRSENDEGSEGDYAEDPEGIQKAIARCDEGLAKLGHR
jgi:tetratricopeptide (TPR) repeat protein